MICVGNVRIKEITTKTGRMGMMTDGVYADNGVEVAGNQMDLDVTNIAKSLGYSGTYPSSYNLGNTIKSMWVY